MTTREHETQTGAAEPPIIDLDAEEVAADPGAGTPDEPRTGSGEAQQSSRLISARTLAAAVLTVAAVIAGAFLYRSFGERYWPGDRITAMEERLSALDAATRSLSNQVEGLGSETAALKSASSTAAARAEDAASLASSTADQLKAIDERLAADEGSLKNLQAANSQLRPSKTGDSGIAGVPAAELDALSKRVAALEETVAALKSAPPSPTAGNAETAVLSQALADLKAKLASGVPYEAESQTIDRLVPGIAALTRLLPYTASGLPTANSLANGIERIAAGLPGTEPQVNTADSGYWRSISRLLGSIVTVRTVGEADWKDIAAKAAADARAGDLAQAIARLDASEAALPAELSQWRDMAKARIGADAAVEEVSMAVLRILSKPAGRS
jgi:hypothetical protein